ncbi:cytochrome P450 [Aspergillus novoparasiticus]|uniref:Cytochrome P450 n=1 Tax=Aspergillus novoparasiticus TaxID=986946 RepID=A0A5N6F3M5_9EURO|nr:cytochrome P450 [Aspergillus novoparasiticus]
MAFESSTPLYDCLIIGGGIAGLSSALSLVRTLHTAVVFDEGIHRNDQAPHLATVPTWDSQDPKRFRDAAKLNILSKYSTVEFANVKLEKVAQLTDGPHKGYFCVWDTKQRQWLGRKVILAMGVDDLLPTIDGFAECWTKGIFHCLVHRGYEERGSASGGVLAIDGDASFFAARHLAFQARNLTDNVVIYTHGNDELAQEVESQLGPCGFRAESRRIEKLVQHPERAQMEVHFEDGQSETVGFIVHRPRTSIRGPFAEQLGVEMTPEGHIKTQFPFNETTVSGVFVAGDAGSQFKIGTQAVVMGAFAAGGVQMQVNAEKWSKPLNSVFNKALGKPFLTKVFGHDYVVLPSKYFDDIKRASPQSLSFFQALSDGLNMEASVGHLYASTTEIDVVVKHLNPRLTQLTPLLCDEAEYAIEKEVGALPDWKKFNVSNLIAAIVHRTTNRILVGKELCRNEEYLAITTKFSRSLFISGIFWNFVRLGPLRKLVAWLTIGLHLRDRNAAAKVLLPHVLARRQEKESGVDVATKYPDALQWTIDTAPSFPGDDEPLHQVYHMLHLTFAASSASGVGVTQCLLNVLAYPEYLEPLREEISAVVARHGGWTDKALSQMALLDSFIRETMRLHPAGSLTVARTIMDDHFRFHDGLTLPKGTNIIAPALAIHYDPDNYEDAHRFDGFRFARYRQKQGESHRWLASTIDQKFLQ